MDNILVLFAAVIPLTFFLFQRGEYSSKETMRISGVPKPSWICRVAPATGRILVLRDSPSHETARRVVEAVKATIDRQIAERRQVGVSVAVALDGELVAEVVGGVRRTREPHDGWAPVGPDDLFMSWSLCKGVAASALLKLVDQGKINYDEKVVEIWPEFNRHRYEHKSDITVGEAVSHRAGLIDPIPVHRLLRGLMGSFEDMWSIGKGMVQDYVPRSAPSTVARYVPVMWSWVIGGVVEHATKGKHIKDVVKDEIATPLSEARNMFLGCLPTKQRKRVVRWESPRVDWRAVGAKQCVVGRLEGAFVNLAANSKVLERHCFPSSNGFFTARAVAKLYGALANDGQVGNTRLFSKKIIQELHETISNPVHDIRHPGASEDDPPARLSLGFCPWSNPNLHKEASRHVLYHAGIGGCFGYGDETRGLAVCVMRNQYLPLSVAGNSIGQEEIEITNAIRSALGEEG